MPRALSAPGTSRVWPTSTTTRKAEGWQFECAGCGGRRRLIFAAGRTHIGDREHNRKRAKQNGSGVPRVRHVARLPCLGSAKAGHCSIKILVLSRSWFYQGIAPITSFAALVHAGTYTCARRAAVVPNKTGRIKQDLHRVKRFGMGKLVGICVVLFMLAVGVSIVTGGPDLAALFAALRAAPLLEKVAWTVIVLVPLVLLPSAVWLCDTLVRQRKAAQALELRLDGVRQGVKELAKSQIDADAAVHHLARTDPERRHRRGAAAADRSRAHGPGATAAQRDRRSAVPRRRHPRPAAGAEGAACAGAGEPAIDRAAVP